MEGLAAVQLTSPSGVAGLRRTPCDVPGNVRLGRRQRPRLAMLVSWPATVHTNCRLILAEGALAVSVRTGETEGGGR